MGRLGLIAMMAALAACGSIAPFAQESDPGLGEPQLQRMAGEVRFSGDSVTIDVEDSGRHSYATATIGDSEPLKLIIDTGSGGGVLDRGIAEGLGLEVVGQREVLSGGVDPIQLDVVRVPHMQVGDMEVVDAEFLTADLTRMAGGTSHGVLGMNLFAEHLISFNQQADEITIARGELNADAPGTYLLIGERGGVGIEVEVVGAMVPMHIDTGAPGGFTFPYELAESLPLQGELREGPQARMVGGMRQTFIGELDGSITLAGRTFENPPVSFLNPSSPSGNLGNQVTSQFLMTVDQRNRLVHLEPLEARSLSHGGRDAASRRVGLGFGGAAGRDTDFVGIVVPGSLAEAAGLAAGDQILSLNGQPMSAYDMDELRDL